jgi:hypothetical protein
METFTLPTGAKLGYNNGNYAFLTGKLKYRFPHTEGYYCIINDCDPARNYNQDATYHISVFKLGKFITDISCTSSELTIKTE